MSTIAANTQNTGVTIPLYTEAANASAYSLSALAGLQKGLFARVEVVGIAGADGQSSGAASSATVQPAGTASSSTASSTSLFQVDTGSWATVLPADMVKAVVGGFDLTKYPQGSLEYSSDAKVEDGAWVPLILAFPDARLPDGTVPTTTVTALVRPEGTTTHMLGIGFNTTYATKVVGETMSSANNAVLNLAAMKSGDMAHSYMIDRDGLHLGWSIANDGTDWTVQQLQSTGVTQPAGSPPDWLDPLGDVTIDGTLHHGVSMLFDTGTPNAFVHYDGAAQGHLLSAGHKVTISVTGEDADAIGYKFVTIDTKYNANTDDPTPTSVWVSPASHGPTNFMNTGANFFRDFSYAYDADKGLVAFQTLDATKSPAASLSISFDFKLTDATVTFENGHALVTIGTDEPTYDVTGIGTLTFTDGAVIENGGSTSIDDLFYYAHNLDVWAAHIDGLGVDADTHYLNGGWREGRDPNAYFSTTGYLAANSDVRAAGVDPLTHFDNGGWKEGRDPSANFDVELYLLNNPDVKAAGVDPLAHYLNGGNIEGRAAYAAIGQSGSIGAGNTASSFDSEYYLLSNPDVAKAAIAAGGDAFAFAANHFQTFGWHEGRDPNAYFDTKGYLAAYADVKAAGVDPLAHYDNGGWREGRDASAKFDTAGYLAANPDVAEAGVDPLRHFIAGGADEGRHAVSDGHFHHGTVG